MTTEILKRLIHEHVRNDPFAAPELRRAIAEGHQQHPETEWAGRLPERDIWLWSKGISRPARHKVRIGLGKVAYGAHLDCLYDGIVYRIHGGGVEMVLGRIGDGTWYDSEEAPTERKAA